MRSVISRHQSDYKPDTACVSRLCETALVGRRAAGDTFKLSWRAQVCDLEAAAGF